MRVKSDIFRYTGNMNTVISMLLLVLLGSFTDDIDREIALQLIYSSSAKESISLSGLAERCQCSTAAIHRFARRLGFEDFRRMKSQLTATGKVRKEQLVHHIELTEPDKIKERIHFLAKDQYRDAEFTEAVRKINDLVTSYSRVVILAAGYPQALSLHYMEDMITMGKPVYALPIGYQMNMPEWTPNTLVIVISITGRLTDYFHKQFQELQESSNHIVFISAKECMPAGRENALWLRIPVIGDDEDANALLAEIFRYMKYDYYRRYGRI